MLRKNLTILILLTIWLPVHGQQKGAESSKDQNSGNALKDQPALPPGYAECVVKQEGNTIECRYPTANSSTYFHRLIAPENLPNLLLVVIGFAGVLAAVLTLRKVHAQAGHMKDQTKILEDSARASVSASRAWMIPHAFSDTIEPINLTWKNVGKSPAVNISATAEYDMSETSSLPSGCTRLKKNTWKAIKSIALEGDFFVITLQNVPSEWKAPISEGTARVMNIHGCVWYKDVLTDKWRDTEFWLDAIRTSGREVTIVNSSRREQPLIIR